MSVNEISEMKNMVWKKGILYCNYCGTKLVRGRELSKYEQKALSVFNPNKITHALKCPKCSKKR